MKTKTISFDLETAKKIQAGEIKGKIKTRNGYDVRIICWNRINEHHTPIVALIDNKQREELYFYSEAGEYDFGSNPLLDLILEILDNEPQVKPKQNFKTVAESDAYAKGYENGFRAGRCVAFDDNKCVALKTNEPQFKPFDKVLVREQSTDEWKCDYFSHIQNDGVCTYYVCIGGEFLKCIPYEGNEHLLGTSDNPK